MSPAAGWLLRVGLTASVAFLQASTAHAFSDPASFQLSPAVAGGGGRFFTGSPADGYTCKSCHEGAAEPNVSVLGLPLAGYRSGARYEVIVEWPGRFDKIALALELTDSRGEGAGHLRLPPQDEVEDPELCEPANDKLLAAQLSQLPGGREIIQVPDCGSKRVRFLWTAPNTNTGPVWFAGSMVSSDGESDPLHDGVTDFGRIISSTAAASTTSAHCSLFAARGRDTRSPHLCTLAALGVSAQLLRRARRRKRHSVT